MSAHLPLPSLREALNATFRIWRPLLVALVVPPVAAIGAAYWVQPLYQAQTKVLVKSGREYLPQSDAGGRNAPSTSMQEAVNSEIEIFTSRDLLMEVIHKLGVTNIYPRLQTAPAGAVDDTALELLSKATTVTPVKLSNVIEVQLTDQDRARAEQLLKEITTSYVNRHISAFSSQRSRLLEEQLDALVGRLNALETERAKFKQANAVFSITEQRAGLISQRERLQNELREAEARQTELGDQVRFLTRELDRTPKTLTLQVDNEVSTVADQASNRLMELRQKEKELLSRFTEDAPPVRKLRSTIEETQKLLAGVQEQRPKVRSGRNPLADQLELQLVNARSALLPIEGRIFSVNETLHETDARLRQLESAEVQLRDMDRQVANLEQDSKVMRASLEEARMNERLDQAKFASITVIEQPHALPKPVFPKKWQFALVGAVLGLFGAGLGVLLSLSFRKTFLTAETVERVLGLPVLGTVPRAGSFAQIPRADQA